MGEGIFFAGLKHVAIKIIASYTEDQIITSDPSQILAIRKAKQDLANINDNVEKEGQPARTVTVDKAPAQNAVEQNITAPADNPQPETPAQQ